MIVLLNCSNSIVAEIRDWSKSPRRIQWKCENLFMYYLCFYLSIFWSM